MVAPHASHISGKHRELTRYRQDPPSTRTSPGSFLTLVLSLVFRVPSAAQNAPAANNKGLVSIESHC